MSSPGDRPYAERARDKMIELAEATDEQIAAALDKDDWPTSMAALVLEASGYPAELNRQRAYIAKLEIAIQRIFRDRREADKITAQCLSVMPQLCESARPKIQADNTTGA